MRHILHIHANQSLSTINKKTAVNITDIIDWGRYNRYLFYGTIAVDQCRNNNKIYDLEFFNGIYSKLSCDNSENHMLFDNKCYVSNNRRHYSK